MYFPADTDDAELVRRSAGGDAAAFEALVARHQRVLYTVALRLLGDAEDARDATQVAFVKAYQALARFDGRHKFFSWVYRILVNESLNLRRARKPQEPVSPLLQAPGGPYETLAADQRRQRVRAALQALPLEYREVIVLRHFADLSYDDIAATLDLPLSVVKSRLYTARQRLCALLKDSGGRDA